MGSREQFVELVAREAYAFHARYEQGGLLDYYAARWDDGKVPEGQPVWREVARGVVPLLQPAVEIRDRLRLADIEVAGLREKLAERDAGVLRENEALRAALKFYADEASWDEQGRARIESHDQDGTETLPLDDGYTAREALAAVTRERALTEIAQYAQDAGAYYLEPHRLAESMKDLREIAHGPEGVQS